ncbi:hypothetical protein KY348_00360 [Candidatus Woesearchaeota archaeon]|nr:hypothetical protein [Candidatus Woesearchaeota archaeon]
MKKSADNKTIQTERTIKNKHRILIFALVLLVIVLSLVIIIRLKQHQPIFPAGESYYNLRMAQALKSDFLLTKDPVQGTLYEPNPYHYLLALLLFLFPVEIVSLFLPLILGVVCAALFYKLLLLIRVKQKMAAFSLIILSVTPAFISLFTGVYMPGFVIFVSLLILVLSLNKRHAYQALCVLLFILLALTSLTGFVITLLILLFLCLVLKRKVKVFYVPLIISGLLIALLTIFSNHTNYTPRMLGFHGFAFKSILSVLQATLGFDLFLILLFCSGFVIVWIKAKEKKLFHLPVLLFVILSFFNIIARAYASVIITVYCVSAITYFYNRKWDLKVIRTGTLLLVFCSLVFSVLNQVNILSAAQPDIEMEKALLFLRDLDEGRVLTVEENGFLVEFYSGKKVLLDSNSFMYSDYPVLKKDSDDLFSATRLKEAEPLLEKHDLHYILITPAMKEELWEGREQELWFLVMHSESFTKKYDKQDVEIWEYTSTPV